ncbi:unnamed protein product [Cylicocyclus nassatus]|uniref:Uncharacterized protein n=1 Tax=Cylicocyclus nassatus TaxID=53992 RepID=A0AA36HD71_CYLNA|nr:unnamed protein product [Cylicocyclus nassatus]
MWPRNLNMALLFSAILLLSTTTSFPSFQWKTEPLEPNYGAVNKLLASLSFYPSEGLISAGPVRTVRSTSSTL